MKEFQAVSDTTQPRVNGGMPGAGQWKSTTHPESHVQLFDRMDSTFLHPTPFKTAEKCIQFWSTVEVPDPIVDQVVAAYAEFRSGEVDTRMDEIMLEWQRKWFEANPQPKDKHIPEWDAKYQSERETYRLQVLPEVEAAVAVERPQGLGEYDVTQLIRAAQMWYHSPSFSRFPEEDEIVRNHQIELFDGFLSVEEIEEKYGLERIHHAMTRIIPDNSTDRIVAALESVDAGLTHVQQEIIQTQAASQY